MPNSKNTPKNDILQSIAAGFPVIYVITWEEERLAEMLADTSQNVFADNREVWLWSSALGFSNGPGRDLNLTDPVAALAFIANQDKSAICLMKDLPAHFDNNPALVRAVRDVYDAYSGRKGTVVFSYPAINIPATLGKELQLLELPLPDAADLLALMRGMMEDINPAANITDHSLDKISIAMQGLSFNEARDLFRQLISESALEVDKALSKINQAKAQMLMKENCLEVISKSYDIDQIGGLKNFKKWVVSRRALFSRKARESRIQPPSGILLMGVSGCGKSLAAKTIPSVWDLPLIRLDMNKIMSGGWGSPEVAWESAIKAAENAAPVVLWIDEIENSFGFLHDTATSGNMTIFSSFLTWMQEKPDNVFVAATANRIEILPPEMIRKGRFDQLFFVDLPEKPARIAILRIHILNQMGNADDYDLDHLAEIMNGWTAAEIEEMVKSARIEAFTNGRRFEYDDIIRSIYRIVPLSKTMPEQLNALRIWSHNRATPAN